LDHGRIRNSAPHLFAHNTQLNWVIRHPAGATSRPCARRTGTISSTRSNRKVLSASSTCTKTPWKRPTLPRPTRTGSPAPALTWRPISVRRCPLRHLQRRRGRSGAGLRRRSGAAGGARPGRVCLIRRVAGGRAPQNANDRPKAHVAAGRSLCAYRSRP
jgi:hypothetical protein